MHKLYIVFLWIQPQWLQQAGIYLFNLEYIVTRPHRLKCRSDLLAFKISAHRLWAHSQSTNMHTHTDIRTKRSARRVWVKWLVREPVGITDSSIYKKEGVFVLKRSHRLLLLSTTISLYRSTQFQSHIDCFVLFISVVHLHIAEDMHMLLQYRLSRSCVRA